ncbi:Gibberellin-regulated protein 11 [Acorus calamus]|uniref:Gibberellin-regulated protein 11 n=1 Tax=Acorus calamus TaxID=4465 RepID=A0AAV9D9U1_ACOCL|nr:Gibberellin-regulated protein 11 [Acorus calamus]
MAFSSKASLASLVLLLLTLRLVHSHSMTVGATDKSQPPPTNCKGACLIRCSKSGRPNLCNRACNSCCSTCKCVPPGTSGNYNVCPCYFKITTHGGARKCP